MNEIRELDQKGLRDFGLIGGAIAAGLFGSLLPLIHHESIPILPWLIAAILWVWALIAPKTLNGIYQIWMRIGLVLGWINTRIILSIVFYALLMPMGLVMRGVFHQDPMKRKLDADLKTYRVIAQVKPREKNGETFLMFDTTQDFLKDLWGFLKERQKFFLLPLIVTLLLLGILIVFAQSSVLAPFIYTLF